MSRGLTPGRVGSRPFRCRRAGARGRTPGAVGYPPPPRRVPSLASAAGVLLGPAKGVKWSAFFFLPFFIIIVLAWRWQARRSAGIRGPIVAGILGDFGWGVTPGGLAAIF